MTKIWGEEMTEEEIKDIASVMGGCELCEGSGETCTSAHIERGEIVDEECSPCPLCRGKK